jgi:NADH-quinone oxidoreductase subunit E
MAALTEELRQRILAYLPRYPSKQAVTLPALHIVHDALRCVPHAAIREIADILDLSPAEVYDTMTFYQFFREEKAPLGQTRLWVCRSLACALRGGDDLLATLCDKLRVQPGETTEDGKITLEFAECLGACEGAPAVMVNDEHEYPASSEWAERIIAWLHQLRGVELASPQLIEAICAKGRTINIARKGSEERRLLQFFKANANVGGVGYNHIILQEDARKIEVLEEFLHGTQERIGIGGTIDILAAEIHVKRFMLRHRRLLGIGSEDVGVLRKMLGEH